MTPVLQNCIDTICLERDSGWDGSFDVVDQLVSEYGEQQLADRIVGEVPRTVPFEVVADLLNILIWSTSDNGLAIMKAAELWLREQTDTRRMLIALNLECIPFSSEAEAKEVLSQVPNEHAIVRSHCTRILEYWAKHR
jgi:hypothetical protein